MRESLESLERDRMVPDDTLARELAAQIIFECHAVSHPGTAERRVIRRKYSNFISDWKVDVVISLAFRISAVDEYRWVAYELLFHHVAFESLNRSILEKLGRGLNSWWTVDAFARILAGPAWLRGQISDATILRWARSPDQWWRRAALVSTVALNRRSQDGRGDSPRTLMICAPLIADHSDTVAKAMSWALRELVIHDPAAVRVFLKKHRRELAARVLSEVTTKLTTGLKNPVRRA
jgi:3-methyladenine DNA glycosylase AlkD